MTELRAMVRDLLADCTTDQQAWEALRAGEFHLVGVPEESGGAGGSLNEAADVLWAVAQGGFETPILERGWVGAWLGATLPGAADSRLHIASFGRGEVRPHTAGTLSGTVSGVAHLGDSPDLVVIGDHGCWVVDLTDVARTDGRSLGGDPRTDLVLNGATAHAVAGTPIADRALRRAALGRAAQICGAAQGALALAVRHAQEREQFGRPLARFQAVQHLLAEAAEEVFLSEQAVLSALEHWGGPHETTAVAAAKTTASTAARLVARHTHQVLGAMGIAAEHGLSRHTTRLWQWAQEHGTAEQWAAVLARESAGCDLWAWVTESDLLSPTAADDQPTPQMAQVQA